MLARGGHAVDAAIAANAVLGVVEPFMNGIGGDLFAMVYESGPDALHGLNASGPAPRGLSPAFLRGEGIDVMPSSGIHSVTVPGAVAGWAALHERFGRLGFAELLAPARFYAEQGFPVGPTVAERWAAVQDAVSAEPAPPPPIFLAEGRPRPARSSATPTWPALCGWWPNTGAMPSIGAPLPRPLPGCHERAAAP